MQATHTANLAQQAAAQLQAVFDLRGRAHVQQCTLHLGVLCAQVDAANQVGFVLFLCHPPGGTARRGALAQGKHTGPTGLWREKCIGMDADKQVGLDATCFLHPHLQRNKKIGIARQVGPHGVACNAAGVDAVAQHFGDFEHHVFFTRATRANGPRVFAAMPGIQRHHDQSLRAGGVRLGRGVIRTVHRWGAWRQLVQSPGAGRGQNHRPCAGQAVLGHQLTQWVIHGG